MNKRIFLLLITVTSLGIGAFAFQQSHPVFLYEKMAQLGYPDMQYRVGAMYANGQSVTRDYNQAAEWYSKAAAQGNMDAQYSLGVM